MHRETGWNIAGEFSARHTLILVLALCGAAVSVYLTLYQYGVIAAPWDPIFGSHSSERVLDSALSRALPVHDGVFGVIAYALEVLITAALLAKPRAAPGWLPAALGLLTLIMAAVSLALVCVQAFVVVSACTLCLVSACISFVNAGLALPEERKAFALGLDWAHQLLPMPHSRTGSRHQEL